MSETDLIKNYILSEGMMDLVGIAPADALGNEPEGNRPEDVLPGAKSIIVYAKRIPDGVIQSAFRYMEDGNLDAQSIYACYGSDLMPNMGVMFMNFNIAEYIERSFGFTAIPVPTAQMQNMVPKNVSLPIFMGPTQRQYIVSPHRAAVAAGLGEIAWSNALVTPEYGPRQQLGMIVTNMPLDYDAPYAGPRLCKPDECGICSAVCPTRAIPKPGAAGGVQDICVCGIDQRVADFDYNACCVASLAFRQEFSGKLDVPNLIMDDNPTDDELEKAYSEKPWSHNSLDHYPKHFCNKCMLYCPLGDWDAKFGVTKLSNFNREEFACVQK